MGASDSNRHTIFHYIKIKVTEMIWVNNYFFKVENQNTSSFKFRSNMHSFCTLSYEILYQ